MRTKINGIRIDRFSNSELLFFLSYFIYLSLYICNSSLYAAYIVKQTGLINAVSVLILVVRELIYAKSKIRHIAAVALGAGIAFLSYFSSDATGFVMTVVFVVLSGEIDIRKLLKVSLVVIAFWLLFVIASSRAGIIEDAVYIEKNRVRRALGFRYVLVPSTYLFNLTAVCLYLKKERIRYLTLLALIALNYLMYRMTVSRLTFVTSVFLVLAAGYYKLRGKKRYPAKRMAGIWKLLIPVYILFAAVSAWLCMGYDPGVSWQARLNGLLGGRLEISKRSYTQFGVSLLGNSSIRWIGQGLNSSGEKVEEELTYVDNLYFNLLQRFGILIGIVLLALLTYMMYRCCKRGDRFLYVILLVLAFHGLIDCLIQHLYYNTFLFMICSLCFGKGPGDRTLVLLGRRIGIEGGSRGTA